MLQGCMPTLDTPLPASIPLSLPLSACGLLPFCCDLASCRPVSFLLLPLALPARRHCCRSTDIRLTNTDSQLSYAGPHLPHPNPHLMTNTDPRLTNTDSHLTDDTPSSRCSRSAASDSPRPGASLTDARAVCSSIICCTASVLRAPKHAERCPLTGGALLMSYAMHGLWHCNCRQDRSLAMQQKPSMGLPCLHMQQVALSQSCTVRTCSSASIGEQSLPV